MSETLEALVEAEPTYRNSKGQNVPIRGMAYPHLKSALAKLLREEPYRADEIDAMSVEVAKRDAEYAAKQAEEELP